MQRAQRTLDVPGEPGQRVTIRPVGWKLLQAALRATVQKHVDEHGPPTAAAIGEALQRYGGLAAVRALGNADPALGYDAATLIGRSVLSWDPPRERLAPGSELEAWLAREILKLSSPRLFEAP